MKSRPPCISFAARASFALLVSLLLAGVPRLCGEEDFESARKEVRALLFDQNFRDALPMLERLSAAHPEEAWIAFEFGFAQLALAAGVEDKTERAKAVGRAHEELERARALGYKSPLLAAILDDVGEKGGVATFSRVPEAEAAMRVGEAAFSRGEMDGAIDAYRQALAFDPHLYEAALFLGDAYFKSERLVQADEWYARAVAIDPARETAYRYWGDSLVRQARPADAREKFIDAVLAQPYARLSWRGLIQWARAMGMAAGHPEIGIPAVKIADADGKSSVVLPEAALEDERDTMLALLYGTGRAVWRDAHRTAEGLPIRNSLAEEIAGLSAAMKVLDELPPDERNAATFENLRHLDGEGLLEAYVLFARPFDGIAQDYPAYRAAHPEKLRKYLTDWFLLPDRKR